MEQSYSDTVLVTIFIDYLPANVTVAASESGTVSHWLEQVHDDDN